MKNPNYINPWVAKDTYGILFLTTMEECFPDAAWLSQQACPPVPDEEWFTGYPLLGGAIQFQPSQVKIVRPAHWGDLCLLEDNIRKLF